MATVVMDRGVYCIRWQENRKRKSISLPGKKFNDKTAGELCRIVEKLLYYRDNPVEVPDKRTKTWLDSAGSVIQSKLAKAGLVQLQENHTLGELWTTFRNQKKNIKDSTLDGYDYAEHRFFFDQKTNVKQLTPENFEDWKTHLLTEYKSPRNGKSLTEATIAGTITKTKAVFNWAKSKKWITETPLEGVGRGSFVNRNNDRIITMDEYRRLLDACPCDDWRAIIALVRIGGLRCCGFVGQT